MHDGLKRQRKRSMSRFRGHHSPPTRRRTTVKFAIALAAALILVVGGYLVGEWLENRSYQEERQQMSENFGLLPTMEYQGQTYMRRPEVTTMLLMGVDQHMDEEPTGSRHGGRADFLLLMALDHKNQKVYQLQIDRDTFTEVPVVGVLGNEVGTRAMQICLAYNYGNNNEERCRHTVQAVQMLLNDEPIDLALAVKLDGIAVLNQALGGIRVTIPEDMTVVDPAFTAGATLTLTDAQTEKLVRARMTVGDGLNVSRMRRQRAFLEAATRQMRSMLASDSDFAGRLFDSLEAISSYTNVTRGRLINEANRAYNYDIQPVDTLAAEYKIGAQELMECHVDKDAVTAWLIKTLYEPKN